MANIVENWTQVTGIVDSVTDGSTHGFKNISIKITKTTSYKKYTDAIVGKIKVTAALKKDIVEKHQLAAGKQITCLVRAAKQDFLIKPDSIKT
ncbi:MAG: hypothetical protein ABI772_00800 [Bacteroidota bacterium]